jgi:hypothetical protein
VNWPGPSQASKWWFVIREAVVWLLIMAARGTIAREVYSLKGIGWTLAISEMADRVLDQIPLLVTVRNTV